MKRRMIIVLIALVVVIGGASIAYYILGNSADMGPQVTDSAGEAQSAGSSQAPDFTVYDEGGKQVRLEDLKGKPIVVNFWASWCGPCRSEMADFDEVYKQLGDEVQFAMINMTDGSRETVETAMEFINGEGYSFPVYFDKDMDASNTYQIYSVPTTYFIDAGGNVVASANGTLDHDTLLEGISMIHAQ